MTEESFDDLNVSDRLEQLTADYYNGCISDEDMAELADELEHSEEARTYFARGGLIDVELHRVATSDPASVLSGATHEPCETVVGKSGTSIPPEAPWRHRWLTISGTVVVLAVVAAVGTFLWQSSAEDGVANHDGVSAEIAEDAAREDAVPDNAADPGYLAWLAAGAGYEFRGEDHAVGSELPAGQYELTRGVVSLRFRNGVELSVEAPASLQLVDLLNVNLTCGRVRAIVPQSGHGFTVNTPRVDVEDLGTEFGVVVEPEGRSEVHVLAGEVKLREQGRERRFSDNQAVVVGEPNDGLLRIAADDTAFLTPTEVGFRQWQRSSETLRHDPSALVYYDFDADPNNANRVINRAKSGSSYDGKISGGIRASGRWRDKRALLFESPGDRVDLRIPGKHEAITIMLWAYVNRFDEAFQTLFATENWHNGEHHLHLLRDGSFRVSIRSAYNMTLPGPRVPSGEWTCVAAVLDRSTLTSRYYINGERMAEVPWRNDVYRAITFGPCSIGGWATTRNGTEELAYIRELRGRIDEFGVFARPFTDRELREVYESGRQF